jgi:hypothetical protein
MGILSAGGLTMYRVEDARGCMSDGDKSFKEWIVRPSFFFLSAVSGLRFDDTDMIASDS